MNENNFLDFSQLDYPYGKEITLGLQRATIYERAIEDGYQAGIQACVEAGLQDGQHIELLTDQEYTSVLEKHMLEGLSLRDQQTWKAYFIAGWVWVCLATPGVSGSALEGLS